MGVGGVMGDWVGKWMLVGGGGCLRKKVTVVKILKRNSSIIFQLEDELLIGDALTYGQMKIINDLKNNLGKLQNKEDIENGENSNNETWNNADCCGLPLSYLQHSSGPKNCEDSQGS